MRSLVFFVVYALWLALLLLLSVAGAGAQAIGGNASIAVTTTSANVQLPASLQTYPVVLLTQAPGSTQEVFFALGTSNAVVATTSSPALPQTVGTCINVGPNGWIAAITASATATLRITQTTTCPVR
jgi:hypothetical protein